MSAKAGRPTDQQKDRDILHAARELVFTEGPQALTMDKVASLAGISKVTLYARYANRYELLQAVVCSEAFTIHQTLGRLPASREELLADLGALLEAITAFIGSDHHQRLMQALGSIPQNTQDLTEVYRNGPANTHRVLADYLQAAAQGGLIRCPEPAASAEMLMGMVMGLDLLRGLYRVPHERRSEDERRQHARRVMAAFMAIHG
ncbi:transcriptional regulator, TetR family [Geopseudomonas sagittaria]|uniref:Transcriptional regulator, TetR family n=1 Tax=Geopseudomonas sagittaria TaxID=1135990 RepID=A0A1I5TFJ4_9GAMM|nr:TetR/AcrR family transcriptional regulator [Pseudomonas sagittaria]SFP81166.1 transcriptional regulator, TetR family [Pseudomonas sagittaria]